MLAQSCNGESQMFLQQRVMDLTQENTELRMHLERSMRMMQERDRIQQDLSVKLDEAQRTILQLQRGQDPGACRRREREHSNSSSETTIMSEVGGTDLSWLPQLNPSPPPSGFNSNETAVHCDQLAPQHGSQRPDARIASHRRYA